MIKSRRMKWVGHIACLGDMRNIYNERKRPLVRHKRRWKDNIKMDLREMELECVDWIHLAQDKRRAIS
jgi:hypothetical protein